MLHIMNRRPMRSYLEANIVLYLPSALRHYYMRLLMLLWSSFVSLFIIVSISDAAYDSASSNSLYLVRSTSQYFNSQNRSASYSCVTFVWLSIAFSDAITNALIANIHTKSRFSRAYDCCSWGNLHSEDNRNDSKNDVINIWNNYIFIL